MLCHTMYIFYVHMLKKKIKKKLERSGVDFMKGFSPVSGSNLRLLSQIIETFYLSPVSISALAEPD